VVAQNPTISQINSTISTAVNLSARNFHRFDQGTLALNHFIDLGCEFIGGGALTATIFHRIYGHLPTQSRGK
jgi:hypothetical protein